MAPLRRDQRGGPFGSPPAGHACLIYRSRRERWRRLAEFVGDGLERGERVLCFSSLGDRSAFVSRLRDAGLNGSEATRSDQLLVRSTRETCLAGGRLSPEERLRQLRTAIRRAARDGYARLRVAGDTAWAAESRYDSRRLLEYERTTGRILRRHGCSALCQYAADEHHPATLAEVRRAHTHVLERGRRSSAARGFPPSGRSPQPSFPRPDDSGRFHALIQNITDVVTEIGPDGTILYESPSVERVLGYRPEDRIGKDVFGFLHPEDRAEARSRFLEVLRRPGTVDSVRVRVRNADGEWRLLEAVGARPPASAVPRVEGVIVTSRDITDRERRSERLERSRRRLRKLSRRLLRVQEEQRKRLSRELHDSVGQTLTALRLRLEGLASGRDADVRARDLLSVVDEAIDEVKEMSASIRPTRVREGRLVPELREFVRVEGDAAGLDVRFRAGEPAEPLDDRVATSCMRIAREAVTNVIRHADAERLTVTLRFSGETVELTVEDDGRGFRHGGESAGGGECERRGLGLTGMLERALSVGGTLDVESRPGRGTRIHARLPLAVP